MARDNDNDLITRILKDNLMFISIQTIHELSSVLKRECYYSYSDTYK